MSIESLFFIVLIVGLFSLFTEAIGNPLWHTANNRQIDTSAIWTSYVSGMCRAILKREGKKVEHIKGEGMSTKAMNAIILWDSVQPYLSKYKFLFCGYCLSTWTAFILLPSWLYCYGYKGFLYFGFHIFLNQFLKTSK